MYIYFKFLSFFIYKYKNMDYTNAPIELLEVSNYLQKIMPKKTGNFNADKALYFYGT